jgi:hypothetical protein
MCWSVWQTPPAETEIRARLGGRALGESQRLAGPLEKSVM